MTFQLSTQSNFRVAGSNHLYHTRIGDKLYHAGLKDRYPEAIRTPAVAEHLSAIVSVAVIAIGFARGPTCQCVLYCLGCMLDLLDTLPIQSNQKQFLLNCAYSTLRNVRRQGEFNCRLVAR